MNIDSLKKEDWGIYHRLMCELENETPHMLLGPGERTWAFTQAILTKIEKTPHSVVLIARKKDEWVGQISLMGNGQSKTAHKMMFGMGVLKKHWGTGVGTQLLSESIELARRWEVKRIELNVAAENQRGISLYEKLGLKHEGRMRDSLIINGVLTDELAMGLLL